jgi:hypothetical protein
MPAISTPLAKGSSTSSLRVGRARLSDGNTIVPTAHASLALTLARTSQPLRAMRPARDAPRLHRSACHVTEHRVAFIKGGRETDSPPMPMQAAPRIKRASTEQDEHVVAPGLLSRVVALFRRQQVRT